MLPVPASPSTPPSAPLPTAVEIDLQARATTSMSRRRSALMWPACCSWIRKRVSEIGLLDMVGSDARTRPPFYRAGGSLRSVEGLGALEQHPAGGDVLVAAARAVAAVGVGEGCRGDQQGARARHHLPALVVKLRL